MSNTARNSLSIVVCAACGYPASASYVATTDRCPACSVLPFVESESGSFDYPSRTYTPKTPRKRKAVVAPVPMTEEEVAKRLWKMRLDAGTVTNVYDVVGNLVAAFDSERTAAAFCAAPDNLTGRGFPYYHLTRQGGAEARAAFDAAQA